MTTLLKGAKVIILAEHHWEEIHEDTADRFWAIFGAAYHKLLEREGSDDFTEEMLSVQKSNIRITGRIDCYNMKEGVIVRKNNYTKLLTSPKTGKIYLGVLLDTIMFTIISCANTMTLVRTNW